MLFIIEGDVIPWKSHRGYGKKSFNPLYKEREFVRWQIQEQSTGYEFLKGAVLLDFTYYLPIPKSFSKKKRKMIEEGVLRPTKRPDCTNCQKFYEDCLKEILFDDDCQVVDVRSRKFYGEKPRVVIKVDNI